MKHRLFIDRLAKMLRYTLGRQPDEFGLLTDEDGFVKIKSLIQALGEENGWRHVRANHLREVVHTTRSSAVEIKGNLVRAADRTLMPVPAISEHLPKLLYHAVRRRAYLGIMEHGLRTRTDDHRITLCADVERARRLGRRIDPSPVILTVNTDKALEKGARLLRYGKHMYLSDGLPQGCFSGPPLPKQKPVPQKQETHQPPTTPKTSGSYLIDPTVVTGTADRPSKGSRRRKNAWKRERKRRSRKEGWP